AQRNSDVVEASRLRFIRSSSASLPPQVLRELEDTFGAPVVEAYAMTEASHQMTCNPLPPGVRKPGTVGPAAGPEVSVMDDEGSHLEPGQIGEIVIRGPNVTPGYESNPEANAKAFTDGWFRTGDQGVMDEDRYVTLTGRLKEIINRGGEKISPKEVDEVLMDHPAVQQVVTFGVPHEKLGEEVAAAVVLREGIEATPAEIRDFAAGRLADFKVPRQILVMDEIPKGPTGKLRRIGLAEQLGLV
ncbi:MAG TPA: AMP-binding protein, partial [Longimicrobiales bacterium]|nr:AMP-binding protein [Longimicrobiales bacterium]